MILRVNYNLDKEERKEELVDLTDLVLSSGQLDPGTSGGLAWESFVRFLSANI